MPRQRRHTLRHALCFCLAATLGIFGLGDVHAQDPSDIFVVDVQIADDGSVTLGEVERLTDRDGYDNQPSFSADGSRVFYTSMRTAGDVTQSDIWQVELKSGKISAVFETPESEYSPTPIPGADALSVIRVENDEKQKLWRLPLDGSTPSRIFESMEPVGYHAWSGDELVLFVLGEPHELRRASAADAASVGRTVLKDIGRSLHKIPGQPAFSFIHHVSRDGRSGSWVKSLSIEDDDDVSMLVGMPEGSEDVAWSADGSLWTGDDSKLLRWRAGERTWTEVADLSEHGIHGISRLAFDATGERLVLVAVRSAKPSD